MRAHRARRGVCGTAAAERRTLMVPDVHAFPGHIACDAASRAEIVVPLLAAASCSACWTSTARGGRFDARTPRPRGLAQRSCASAAPAPAHDGAPVAARPGCRRGAFTIWGCSRSTCIRCRVPALQVIAHRITWSCLFILGWMLLRGELRQLAGISRAGAALAAAAHRAADQQQLAGVRVERARTGTSSTPASVLHQSADERGARGVRAARAAEPRCNGWRWHSPRSRVALSRPCSPGVRRGSRSRSR